MLDLQMLERCTYNLESQQTNELNSAIILPVGHSFVGRESLPELFILAISLSARRFRLGMASLKHCLQIGHESTSGRQS